MLNSPKSPPRRWNTRNAGPRSADPASTEIAGASGWERDFNIFASSQMGDGTQRGPRNTGSGECRRVRQRHGKSRPWESPVQTALKVRAETIGWLGCTGTIVLLGGEGDDSLYLADVGNDTLVGGSWQRRVDRRTGRRHLRGHGRAETSFGTSSLSRGRRVCFQQRREQQLSRRRLTRFWAAAMRGPPIDFDTVEVDGLGQ